MFNLVTSSTLRRRKGDDEKNKVGGKFLATCQQMEETNL